jgi:hypothetical protein
LAVGDHIVIAVDPGLVTGLAVVGRARDGNPFLLYSNELSPMLTGQVFESLLEIRYPQAEIVVERFTITVATAKNSQAPWSLKVIGMIEWLVWRHSAREPEDVILFQSPGDAKRMIPNKLLQTYGVWHKGGAGHANDALRHGLYRHAKLGWREPWKNFPT